MYYELHITVRPTAGAEGPLQSAIESYPGWHYSCIYGDPVLGKHPYCYATTHIETTVNIQDVITHLESMGKNLRRQNFSTIREKVELVLYDKRRKDD
jgi:hypothetical protein